MPEIIRKKARSISVFLRGGDGQFSGGVAALLPEKTVLDYVLEEARPITVPHGQGWITAFPLPIGHSVAPTLNVSRAAVGSFPARTIASTRSSTASS